VFDDLGPYDISRWRYFTWDPAAEDYVEVPAAKPAVPGQGFWIISRDSLEVGTDGRSTDLSAPTDLVLEPGFNQISNPYAFPVAVANLSIPAGVDSNFISFDGAGYVPDNQVLEPGRGYWIRNTNASPANLRIPRFEDFAGPGPAPARPAPGHESGWDVRVRAAVGEFRDERSWSGGSVGVRLRF